MTEQEVHDFVVAQMAVIWETDVQHVNGERILTVQEGSRLQAAVNSKFEIGVDYTNTPACKVRAVNNAVAALRAVGKLTA